MNTKILVIEDHDDIRENIVEILTLAGYDAHHAQDGKAGCDLAFRYLPDLILCDITMPELDGYGVLYLLSKNPKTQNIPFIFLTAKGEHTDIRKAMEMGADDYLIKPFESLELLNAIESRLKKRAAQQALQIKAAEDAQVLSTRNNGLPELKRIIRLRSSRQFKKGSVIFREGDIALGLYLIIAGSVKTIKLEEGGRELMTGIYGPDDYLGVNALLLNGHYTDTATALETTSLCFLPKDILDPLLNKQPDLGKGFLQLLAHDIQEKEDQLMHLAYHSVRKRMAESLMKVFKQQQASDTTGFEITREDLAAMAGVATETVSRTLSDFKDEKLIDKQGSKILILDAKRLAKMKN